METVLLYVDGVAHEFEAIDEDEAREIALRDYNIDLDEMDYCWNPVEERHEYGPGQMISIH